MNGRKFSVILAYAVATFMILAAIAVFMGALQSVRDEWRVPLSVVFLLMGIYRILVTRMQQARRAEENDE